jgi:hypothetical protein
MPSSTSTSKTTIVVVSKAGTLSECQVEPNNETTLEELTVLLSKKCGYRNHDGFSCYHTWRYKNKKKFSFQACGSVGSVGSVGSGSGSDTTSSCVPKYIYIDIWGKTDGRAGNETKYELPPPIDDLLFFGNLALVARIDKETAVNLTVEIWSCIYEKLFGGFEDLAATALEDENESDELAGIPASMKTHNGYLKDGFIVEDDSEDTPRVKPRRLKSKKGSSTGGGKKNKSESTESEFITETETESLTQSSDSPMDSDADADVDADADADADTTNHTSIAASRGSKKRAVVTTATNKPKRTIKKQSASKPTPEEPVQQQEIESELSEESYD